MGLCSPVVAQSKYWREIKGKPLVKFDWNCASPTTLPKSLSQLIETALKGEAIGSAKHFADRAFAYDLNRDGKPEYFVPLNCGATGNCTFGLFTLKPKSLGKVNGEYIYAHARTGAWPDLITYAHFTAVEGDVFTYTFKRKRYQARAGHLHTDSRGGIYGKKAPAFLGRARKGCKTVGY
jgi:hypothetical protein